MLQVLCVAGLLSPTPRCTGAEWLVCCVCAGTYLNSDCAVCVQVCPYNRGRGIADTLWKALAGTPLRHVMKALHTRQLDSKRSNRGWAGLSEVGRKLKPERWWAGLEQAVEEARVPRQRKQRAGKKKGKAASKRKPKAKGAARKARSAQKASKGIYNPKASNSQKHPKSFQKPEPEAS